MKMLFSKKFFMSLIFLILVCLFLIVACSPAKNNIDQEINSQPTRILISPRITQTISPTPSITPTIIPTLSSPPTASLTPTFSEPIECQKPPDEYEMISINGMLINQRTYSMLQHAQMIYEGELELTGYHLTQGSYTNLVDASFGTHNGGGAVDISVIQYGTYNVLYEDIEPLIYALRVSGLAAWLRDFDQLYPGSPIHIHAIAIGDRDLSVPASEQLVGDFGYFRGFNGLPQANGVLPEEDEHGGPVICQWMLAMGYSDLRTPYP